MRSIAAEELTGPLLRAARALACIRAEELAALTKLGLATIKRAEASDGAPPITLANAERITESYERLGVFFVADGTSAGVVRDLRRLGGAS